MDEIDPINNRTEYMGDYKKDLEDYFCRFTFGQFVTLVLFEVVTLFFVFYLGAKYGTDLVGGRVAARQAEVQTEDGVLPQGKKSVDDIVGDNAQYSYPDVLSGNSKAIRIKPSGMTAEDAEKNNRQAPIQVPSARAAVKNEDEVVAAVPEAREIKTAEGDDLDVEKHMIKKSEPPVKSAKEVNAVKEVKKTPGQLTAEELEREAIRNRPAPIEREEPVAEVEPVQTPQAEAVPAGITKRISGNYSLQMGSYPTIEEAQTSQQNWKKKGYSAFITEAEIPGKGTWYRVRLGSFPNKDKAKALLDKIKKQEKKTGIVVSNKG